MPLSPCMRTVQLHHAGRLGDDVAKLILARDLPPQLLHETEIPKSLHSPDHFAGFIPQKRRAHADGNLAAVGPQDGHRLVDDGLAGLQTVFQNARGFADVGSKHLAAQFPQSLSGRDPGDDLGGTVEKRDSPLQIHREYPVGDAVENDLRLRRQLRMLMHGSPLPMSELVWEIRVAA